MYVLFMDVVNVFGSLEFGLIEKIILMINIDLGIWEWWIVFIWGCFIYIKSGWNFFLCIFVI